MTLEQAVAVVLALGGLSGIAGLVYVVPTVRKLRAEGGKLAVEAATLETSAEDAHDAAVDARYAQLLKAQVEHIVQPLERRVTDQGALIEQQGQRIARLEADLLAVTNRYRDAIHLLRRWRRWIERHVEAHHHGDPDIVSDLAAVPDSIAHDL